VRCLLAAIFCANALFGEAQLNPPVPVVPAISATMPASGPVGPSLVVFVSDERALSGFDEDRAVTREMVGALVRAVTGKAGTAAAWRSLVAPEDRVGIKVTAVGGRYFGTRRGVVAAVVEGLREAGVQKVFVWDRSAEALRGAGFTAEAVGCDVRAIEPPRGWDRAATFHAPVLGKLIWGDLLFSERAARPDSDPLSSKSHLATALSRDCTKWINIPVLSDEPGCGVAGALHSSVIGNLDNWRRFTSFGAGGAAAIPEMYADPRLGGKCVLHILDALLVTYAGGPRANPQNSIYHATLYASRDPVALDSTGLRLMDRWREAARLGPIGAKAGWLKSSGIGNAELIQMKSAR
jgi:uncharacterized protein (DUF362 family)